mmetsp:Transcript_5466/g.8507  ORF Transcript_5466/g.8507 Transcript_5466/m.8507 type:complete len:136 (+) Transcript_5466:348-755(+)
MNDDSDIEGDFDFDAQSDNSDSSVSAKGSTKQKLSQIERKIQSSSLSKRERRLLQNRKSALKCRLKKQGQLDKFRGRVDKLHSHNRSLQEKVAALNALIEAKNHELASLSSKFDNLQMQQIFFMTTVLSQVGVDV